MNAKEKLEKLEEKTYKELFNAFYTIVGIVCLIEIVVDVVLNLTGKNVLGQLSYAEKYILLPTVLNALCVFFAERSLVYVYDKKRKQYTMIGCLSVLCLVIATVHAYFPTLLGIFAAPIILAVIFDSERVLMVAAGYAVIGMGAASLLAPLFDDEWSIEARVENGLAGLGFLVFVYIYCHVYLRYVGKKNEIIAESSNMQDHMMEAIQRDMLTGLYNHTAFYAKLEDCIEQSRREKKFFCLSVIDIDFFKRVNDDYGHENGNVVLIRLSALLKERCEGRGYVARYGGEEFTVICMNMVLKDMEQLMEEIRQAIYDEEFSFMPGKHISISCGIYKYSGNDMKAEAVFERADSAMYQAKTTGRNRCIVCRD